MNKLKIIIVFTIITYALTFLFLKSDSIWIQALSQASPAIATLLLVLVSKQKINKFKELGLFNFGRAFWYIIALILPAAAIVIAYLIAAILGYFSLDLKMPWYSLIYQTVLFTFMWPLIWAITEEIGWRGFLQPKLITHFGVRQGIFFTGVIWSVWHYIFIFYGNYYEAGNPLINTVLFTITVILMSFAIGWIRWENQSTWPCILFHSASNATWQVCSYQFNIKSPYYIYVAGEAGILNIIFWGIILLIIYRRLGRKLVVGETHQNILIDNKMLYQ